MLMSTNYNPQVLYCTLLRNVMIGSFLTKINNPVRELPVITFPSLSASTNMETLLVFTSGSGICGVSYSSTPP